jgi:hypothetical protein
VKRIILYLLAFMGFALLLGGCPAASYDVKAKLGHEFILPVGQRAAIEGEDLELRFKTVLSDNRCPRGAQCIIAGEVRVILEIKQDGSSDSIELSQPGLFEDYSLESYGQYKFIFKILPYPEVGHQIADDDYELKLTVTAS